MNPIRAGLGFALWLGRNLEGGKSMWTEKKGVDLRELRAAYESEAPVLITGETGTGKSSLAEWIHRQGARGARPFVAINLATLHEGTLESELFGHERGSFTGADHKRVGKLESAQGGTVFLDEIAELHPRLQGKLLEFLQNKTIVPIGSNREVKLDVRIISATHKDLDEHVKQKKFREDLFYRIRMINLSLRALRELNENFGEIVQDCISEFSAKHSKRILRISREFACALESHDWPGNFRELRNALEYTIIVDNDGVLDLDDLPRWFNQARERRVESWTEAEARYGTAQIPLSTSFHETVARFERAYLKKALEMNRGRVNQTARTIGLSKATLIRRIKDFRLREEAV